MHFVDRSLFPDAPLEKLSRLHETEQEKWLAYKREERSLPSGHWNKDEIKTPLAELFQYNCGYCGTYAGLQNDGEVDHHFPKKLDEKAEKGNTQFPYEYQDFLNKSP